MTDKPTIGVIVPPASGLVPPECLELYSDRADFIAIGLGLDRLTPEGYSGVVDNIPKFASQLVARGAGAVSMMGTSLSFFRGVEFNRQLVKAMAEATGVPVMSMSDAVIDAMAVLGVKRVAVGTAYIDEVNNRLVDFLVTSGITTGGLVAMDITNVEDIAGVTDDHLLDLGRRAHAACPDADAIFLSCGGFQTLAITPVLEAECGKPVISSAVAGAWGAFRMTGGNSAVAGHGRLLAV